MTIGDPRQASTDIDPVATGTSYERILSVVNDAGPNKSNRLVGGGRRPSGEEFTTGYYLEPTFFADVDPDSNIARKEVFDPVLSVMTFDDEEQAVAMANASVYGLSAWVQTSDVGRVHRPAGRLEAGKVWVNGRSSSASRIPFGGVKSSGFGRLGGIERIRAFEQTKNVWVNLPDALGHRTSSRRPPADLMREAP